MERGKRPQRNAVARVDEVAGDHLFDPVEACPPAQWSESGGYEDQRIRCFDPGTRTWHPGPNLPTEQAWAAAVTAGGRLYIVAGAHLSRQHGAIVFDDRTYVLRPR